MALVVRPVADDRHDPGRSGRGAAACTPRAGSGRGRPSANGPRTEPSVHRQCCHRRSRQAAPGRNVAGSGGGPGPGVRSVAFHVPARRRWRWRATMAAGACTPGVASGHDVTGHVVWSGSRTHDRRNQDPLLYPTELSSWGPRGIEPRTGEPAPASSRRSRRWHVRDLRHTPRQRRAHQPVVETGPLENRGCRPPTLSRAIMFGSDADNVQAPPLARSKSFRGAGKSWVSERRVAALGAVLASRVLVPTQTKTPPGLAFRGRRQASEIGVADLRRAGIRPLSAGVPCRTRAPARPCAGMAAVWRWRRNARSREVSSGC